MGRQSIELLVYAVGEVPLPMSPYLLDGIERGGISWERINMKSLGLTKERLDLFALMDLAAIPDENNVAGQVAQQVLQESNDSQPLDILFEMKPEIESQVLTVGRDCKTPDNRDLVPAVTVPQYRSLPHGGPGLTDVGDEQEAAFVEKCQVGLEPSGFFLYVARYNVSNEQSPCRFFGWLGAPASEGSNEALSEASSKRPPGNSGLRDVSRSIGRCVLESITPWHSLPPAVPSPTAAGSSLSAFGTIARDALESVGPEVLSVLVADELAANGPPNSARRRERWLRLGNFDRAAAWQWPAAGDAPIDEGRQEVSCLP